MEKRLAIFKAGKKGFDGVLGNLEKDIMEVLWDKEGVSGREVFEHLKSKRKIALTTVLTVIERLVKKDLVKKEKGDSTFIYKPKHTQEDFSRNVSRDVFKRVMGISGLDAIASFVNVVADADPKELDRLSRLIDAKKKEMKKGA